MGASWPKYEAAAKIHHLKIIRLPMIEGSCPNTFDEIVEGVKRVNIEMSKGDNVLVHCRGGNVQLVYIYILYIQLLLYERRW